MQKILFVTHKQQTCGVYQYGLNVYNAIKDLPGFLFTYAECGDIEEVNAALQSEKPDAVIFNYYPATLGYLTQKTLSNLKQITRICLVHDMSASDLEAVDGKMFHYYIYGDPTLRVKNPRVFSIGRLLPTYTNPFPEPSMLTIGSFGFGGKNKGYERLIKQVQKEFDHALIRINIPFNNVVDPNGRLAKNVSKKCQKKIKKKGIRLEITHHFFSPREILDYLAQNTINVFLYRDKLTKGIASSTEFAIAARRPVAISDCFMFRHLFHLIPSIIIPNWTFFFFKSRNSLRKIINNGTSPLSSLYEEWSIEKFTLRLEEVLNEIMQVEKKDMSQNLKNQALIENVGI